MIFLDRKQSVEFWKLHVLKCSRFSYKYIIGGDISDAFIMFK